MAEEIITLISKDYATGNFQSKLTEANEGDNIKITGEGDNLKISAEIPAHAKTTITTSDERVAVTETQTGYDLGLNGSFIEEGEYRVLENTVGGHTTSITNLEQSVAGKQDTLSAGTGINLNNNTISVDTATTVGTSDLPVTASAVNTKLGDYATTTDLNNKQDKLSWYHEPDGYPYKADMAANEVTLRAGGDTSGMIDENAKISLSEEDGQISITSNFGGSDHSHLNILKTEKELIPGSSDCEKIVIGDTYNGTSVFIAGPLYDKDGNEITGGSSFKYISEDDGWAWASLSLGRGPNGTANSIFVCGPLYGETGTIFVNGPIKFSEAYDKDGREIKGGGGGAGYDYITEDHTDKSLTLQTGDSLYFCVDENSTFTNGPIVLTGGYGPGTVISDSEYNGAIGDGLGGFAIRYQGSTGGKQFKIGMGTDTTWTDAMLELASYDYNGTITGRCQLDGPKLNKLSSLINNADALLALLNN